MKFWKIFQFEFRHQLLSLTTWIYLAVLFLFTMIMNALTTPGDGVVVNNTFHITSIVVIGGFIWLIMGAAIAGEAAAGDVKTRMHPLTYSTPIEKYHYLGGRFLAAFTINALLILSLPIGVLLSFYLPGINDGELLAFNPWPYLNVYFLIALPNVFIVTALQFSFAALSRNVMTSYMASLLLALFPQVIAISAAQLFESWDLLKLLDPIGIAGIIGSELSTWTPTEKNTRVLVLSGMFLWNRILWLSVATALLWYTSARFSFANAEKKTWLSRFRKRKIEEKTNPETVHARPVAITIPKVYLRFTFEADVRQTLRIARASFGKIAKNPAAFILVAGFALASAIFGDKILSQFGIPLIPTTQQVIDYLTAPITGINSPWVIIPLLIMYFAGQLVWSERDARINDIADATPVSEWALFTGKFLGLSLIILIWMMILLAGGMLMQVMMRYSLFETGLYMKALFGLQLLDYLLFALLSLVIHVVVNQKNLGYLVMLLVFIFLAFPSTFKVEHHMLIFGAGPEWTYTDMRGFGSTLWPWLWFKLYWFAWALMLAIAARLLWSRGRESRFRQRLQLVKNRFTNATVWFTIAAATFLVAVGSFLFYNTNILNNYHTLSDVISKKAEYEKRYGRYRNTLQPQLRATKLNIEIYPERQRAEIHAVYTLVNNDTVAIDSIHLGSISGVEPLEVKFNVPARAVVIDHETTHQIHVLEKSLKPSDSVQLSFVVIHQQFGFGNRGTSDLVVKNGTYFTNYDLLPTIGYLRHREISDAVVRKENDLGPRPAIPSLYDNAARRKPLSTDVSEFEAIIGTAKDEVAVAPGNLQRTWTEGDRNYFHFKTDAPIRDEYAILSGNYQVYENRWNDVAISLYYHPAHAFNIQRMYRSVMTSLEFYTQQFGPYPYRHITFVERAGSTGGASSEASMIDFGEHYAIMNPADSPTGFDLPYYILAHEVAHQWFGGAQITPAYVEGAGVLIEGLAVYAGMQVLEKTYGDGHLQKYLSFLHSFYEMPRSLATPSLLQANESFLYYRKGGLAMYALSKYIGKQKVNGALRTLLEKHKSGKIEYPTTLDLYREIKNVTPDSLNYLLNDFFETNTYWRLKTKQFTVKENNGKWDVTLNVQAYKFVVDSAGIEHDVPMNDLMEIGIYEQAEGTKPLYLQMHRIKSGDQVINVTVSKKPFRGGIDPNHLTIDLRLDDNVMYFED